MVRILFGLTLAAATVAAIGCAAEEPTAPQATGSTTPAPRIAVVGTWGDLWRQPVIEAGRPTGDPESPTATVKLRLGIEGSSSLSGDGLLVYVLTEDYLPVQVSDGPCPVPVSGVWLRQQTGPVWVDILHPEAREPEEASTLQMAGPVEWSKRPRRRLFVAPVVCSRAGRLRVSVRDFSGRTLAETEVDVAAEKAHGWTLWSLRPTSGDLPARRPGDPADLVLADLACGGRGSAVPAWQSHEVLAEDGPQGGPERYPGPCVAMVMPSDGTVPLPTFQPRGDAGTLTLAVTGDELDVESPRVILASHPERHFLARWWVNGRPVQPAGVEAVRDVNGKTVLGRHVRVRMTLDLAGLGAKPGDRLGLQLLYCPQGWTYADELLMRLTEIYGGADLEPLPALTNRVEFVAK